MAFQTVSFNVVGGTYENKSRPLSNTRTINMYQQVNPKAKDQSSLQSFPGQKFLSSVSEIKERGTHRMKEVLYRVVDKVLYQVNSLGIHLKKGVVTGSDRCIFANDGESLVIVSDRVYVYNSFTNLFSENTNPNIVGTISVTIINNQFIYTRPDFSFMAQPGDPFDVNGLDGVGAESSPDELVRDYAFNQTIYRFGVRTTEPWYNSGVGRPPIDRIEGQEFSVGLGAIHSLINTDRALYWLGDDKAIYRVSGGTNERISDDGISNTIENMTTIEDAIGNTFTLQGQDFYMITFPSENKTLVINESLGKDGWFELQSGTVGGIYSATSIISAYDKTFVCSGGKLLTLENNTYTQDSDVMLRRRTMLPITRKNIPSNIKGRRIKISSIEFIMEQGVGLITGQGVNPRMLLELSFDGGRSFAHSQWVELGRQGQNTLDVTADVMASADEIIPRITLSDPVPFAVYSGLVDIKAVAR